MFIMKPIRKPN